MKKLYILFTAAAFTAAACTSNLEIDTPDVTPEDNTPEVVDPDNDGTNDGLVPLTFSIAAEGMTKTTIGGNKTDGYTVSWATGDKVRIVWNDGSKSAQTAGEDYYIADVNAKTGEVAGYIPAGSADDDVFYAVYPETADYTLLEDGTLTITIPREQSGTFKDANIMVAKTTKGEAHLAFKNMTSIISFSTSASMKSEYKYITFAANQLNTYALSGTVSTNFSGKTFTASAVAGSTSDRSYVSKTKSGALASGKTYYLAVLPETGKETISNGLGFKIQDSKFSLICGGMSKSDFVRSRGAVASLGAIDTKVRESWFIKQDGSDTGGKDWDHAGNAKRLVELLVPSYSESGTTAAWRLTGATIYVAEGTYNLQTANGGSALSPNWGASGTDIRIKGGYSSSSSGSVTTGDDPNTHFTDFICSQTSLTDRIFNFTGKTFGKLTFEGIRFPANGPHITTGTVLYVKSSDLSSEIHFKNCSFNGFVQSSTISGGPIYINTTPASGKITFDNCSFSGNKCNTGGAVYTNTSFKGTIEFKNCLFSDNTAASGAAGGSLRVRSGSLIVDNCSFEGPDDISTLCAGNGGAIATDGSTVFDIRNSSFNNFKVTTSGSAIYLKTANASAFIGNCVFTNCVSGGTSNTSGGVVYSESGAKILVANSTFSSCSSGGNNSAIFIINGAGSIYIVSSTLSDCSNQIISRGVTYFHIYNSILLGGTTLAEGTDSDIKKYYSIYGSNIYTLENSGSALGDFSLGSFINDVYLLDNNYSTTYNNGMTSSMLRNETYNITLTDDQKDLLAKDQKGNDRGDSKIMGAYVLTTAPTTPTE